MSFWDRVELERGSGYKSGGAVVTLVGDMAPKNYKEEAKPDVSLLPMDMLVKYVVPAYQEGLIKYQRESWRKGFLISVMVAAALRHIIVFFWLREDWDPDAEKLGIKKHHLGGAIFSLLSILWTLEIRPELDDRPGKGEG